MQAFCNRRPILAVLFAFSLWACPREGKKSASTPPQSLVTSSSEKGAKVENFVPPQNGRLEQRQIEDYLRALERAIEIGRTSSSASLASLSSPAGDEMGGTPDVAAARQLRLRVEEFLWVRERVIEVIATEAGARLDQLAISDIERTLGALRARSESPADDGSRKLLASQLEIFSKELERVKKEAARPIPESLRANMEIVRPYRERAAQLQEAVMKLSRPVVLSPSPSEEKK